MSRKVTSTTAINLIQPSLLSFILLWIIHDVVHYTARFVFWMPAEAGKENGGLDDTYNWLRQWFAS